MNVFDADTKRIHIGGFSQVSEMTWRFLCNFWCKDTDTFASAAPTSETSIPNKGKIPCDLPRTPVLQVNGFTDPLAVYADEAKPLLATVRQTIGDNNLEERVIQEGSMHRRRLLT